jgi:hypothetical protein
LAQKPKFPTCHPLIEKLSVTQMEMEKLLVEVLIEYVENTHMTV